MKHKKKVTIKDVAQQAGVAVSTVSRVLNNRDRVSDKTRKKVEQTSQKLGFVRNAMAVSIKTGRTKIIVVVVPDIINEFYTAIVQGVESVAADKDYFTLVSATRESKEKESKLFDGQLGRIADGIILIPAHNDLHFIKKYDKPVVIVDRYISGSGLETVVIDNYMGTVLLTKELLANGHRNIAILIGPRTFNIGQDRLRGYTDTMQQAGVPVKEENVVDCTWYADSGYKRTCELLDRPTPPSAIIATNNLLCTGCIEAIMERRLTIGENISLVGFDDTLLAQYTYPKITVVKRETVKMGCIGARKLIGLIEGEQRREAERKVILPVELVRRNSVRRLL